MKTILIIDDDPNIRELLKVNLEYAGYHAITIKNGNEVTDILASVKPDLILLDIMMPGTDGWEVCKIVRDRKSTCDPVIIMLTARDSEKDKIIGKDIFKADEYITKPFQIGELLAVIKGYLND